MLTLTLQHTLQHRHDPTPGTLAAAALFGLTLQPYTTTELIPATPITLRPAQVVFLTGTSGGGKSTALRTIRDALGQHPDPTKHHHILTLDHETPLPELPLIEGFGDLSVGHDSADVFPDDPASPAAAITGPLRWLSWAGLGDAHLMLRKPRELSEGQRHRFGLARLFAEAERTVTDDTEAWPIVIADEFLTPLDRTTARAVAAATARWARAAGATLLAATAHDDLIEALGPDLLLDFSPDGLTVSERDFKAGEGGGT